MDINKKIVKSLLEKNYSEMKDLVFKSLYAKASLLMDEERVAVADVLFNEGSGGMYDDDDTTVAPGKKKPKDYLVHLWCLQLRKSKGWSFIRCCCGNC